MTTHTTPRTSPWRALMARLGDRTADTAVTTDAELAARIDAGTWERMPDDYWPKTGEVVQYIRTGVAVMKFGTLGFDPELSTDTLYRLVDPDPQP